MDLGLRNKGLVLVGGTTGMGYAAAEQLADVGARLALVCRDEAKGDARAAALRERCGTQVVVLSGDGTRAGSLEAAIDRAATLLDGLDGLAVTAGPMLARTPFADTTDADWEDYFQNQLMLTVRACRAMLPHLRRRGGGSIVTTAAHSIRAQKPQYPAYAAMKSAIASLTKNIAKTYGADGVRANCICPGAIATEALDEAKATAVAEYGGEPDAALDRYMVEKWGMQVALGRAGRPHEVGELIAFLLSRRAGYMTGALINIDGGTDF
jgi:3-oxoacyl-[acyl-carrier protein] reductase